MQLARVLDDQNLPLGPLGLDIERNPEHVSVVSKLVELEKEDLEQVILRLVNREKMPEDLARKLRIEFLRYISLDFATNERISPSPLVDEFWHAFILFTRDYTEFCNRHFGRYLHHEPQNHAKAKALRDGTPGMRTKRFIEKLFPTHDPDIWAETAICSNSHCDKVDF